MTTTNIKIIFNCSIIRLQMFVSIMAIFIYEKLVRRTNQSVKKRNTDLPLFTLFLGLIFKISCPKHLFFLYS